jgi:hypothetical protein
MLTEPAVIIAGGGPTGLMLAGELPAIGVVRAPSAVLIRPDGYVAWVGQGPDQVGLADALTAWFGPPLAA